MSYRSLEPFPNTGTLGHDPFPPVRDESGLGPQVPAELDPMLPHLEVGRFATFTTGRLHGPERPEFLVNEALRPFESTNWGPGLERLDIPY